MYTVESPQEDLLLGEEVPERASTGKRFANYIIDIIIFYILLIAFGFFLAILFPTTAQNLTNETPGFSLFDRLLSLVFYAVYMSIVEMVFKGKSVGKFITKTKAVNLDGSRISNTTAIARGFSRAVPFCAFSAFGTPCNPWQDKWTNTMVVDDKS